MGKGGEGGESETGPRAGQTDSDGTCPFHSDEEREKEIHFSVDCFIAIP